MNLGLEGKVALITGSSQGIGAATARLFAAEGAKVGLTYKNYKDRAESIAQEIREVGGESYLVHFDLASENSIMNAVNQISLNLGEIDILVNNALDWGKRKFGEIQNFDEMPSDEIKQFLRINVEGPYLTTKAVLSGMRKRGWGRIIYISSGLARNGLPGSGIYSGSKAALHGLTRSLFREQASNGILTNVVMAGATLTEHLKAAVPSEILDQIKKTSPLKRIPSPEEVAVTIVFLASAANTTINGEIILSSGGHS
jgi:3-oxoacyl-[acyl-carrier protein] reductase